MAMVKTIKFNRKELEDKIYACWLGKNIGGTTGKGYYDAAIVHYVR